MYNSSDLGNAHTCMVSWVFAKFLDWHVNVISRSDTGFSKRGGLDPRYGKRGGGGGGGGGGGEGVLSGSGPIQKAEGGEGRWCCPVQAR